MEEEDEEDIMEDTEAEAVEIEELMIEELTAKISMLQARIDELEATQSKDPKSPLSVLKPDPNLFGITEDGEFRCSICEATKIERVAEEAERQKENEIQKRVRIELLFKQRQQSQLDEAERTFRRVLRHIMSDLRIPSTKSFIENYRVWIIQ